MDFIADPTFWTAAALVVFAAVALYVRMPAQIAKGLDERAARIRREIDEARSLRDEADKLAAGYRKTVANAARESEDILALARKDAARALEEGRRSLAELIDRRRHQAGERIARAEAEAVSEVRDFVATVAVAAAQRFIRERMDGMRAANLIDAAIADIPVRLKGRG